MLTRAVFGLAIALASVSGSLAARAGTRSRKLRPSTILLAPTSRDRDLIPSLLAGAFIGASRANEV
jgi:hypothetical protein